MKRSIIFIIAAVVVVGVIAVVLTGMHSAGSPGQASSSNNTNQPAAATITYTSSGFSPDLTTVKAGEAVAFVNKDSSEIQVDSNPHPVHTDDTDLNVGPISPGATKTITVTKKGTFGFHNHLEPDDTAKITIQ